MVKRNTYNNALGNNTYLNKSVENKALGKKFINELENRSKSSKPNSPNTRITPPDYLGRQINYSPYKANDCYPGEKYLLVGASYNVEITTTKAKRTRINAIDTLFGKHSTILASKALKNPGFYESLSHFERDWLSKVKPKTVLTRAYSDNGELVNDAFAVWRPILSLVDKSN